MASSRSSTWSRKSIIASSVQARPGRHERQGRIRPWTCPSRSRRASRRSCDRACCGGTAPAWRAHDALDAEVAAVSPAGRGGAAARNAGGARDVPAGRPRPDQDAAVERSAAAPRPQRRPVSARQFPGRRHQLVLARVAAAVRRLRSAGVVGRRHAATRADGEAYDGIRKDTVHVGGRLTAGRRPRSVRQPTSDSARTMVTTATTDALVVVFAPGIDAGGRGASVLDRTAPAWRRRSADDEARGGSHDARPSVARSSRRAAWARGWAAACPSSSSSSAAGTMLERSLAALAGHPRVSEVVVALPAAHLDPPPAVPDGRRGRAPVRRGRGRRAASGFGGQRVRRGERPTPTSSLVHDAARPFVSAALIERMIDAGAGARRGDRRRCPCPRHGEARRSHATGARSGSTRRCRATRSSSRRRRRRSGARVLARAIAAAGDDDVTDEAMLVERAGGVVHLVEGEARTSRSRRRRTWRARRRRRRRGSGDAHRHRLRSASPGGRPAADPGRRATFRSNAASTATPTPTSSATP